MKKATPSVIAAGRAFGVSRRDAIRTMLVTATCVAVNPFSRASADAAPVAAAIPEPKTAEPAGPFSVPPLPYGYNALEPYIDTETMQIHHDKHHATYVKNLNAAVAKQPELAKKTVQELISDLDSVPDSLRTAIRNNGGGHYNHTLFWETLKKNGGAPKGDLSSAINKTFGSYDAFQDQFTKLATGQFGSGWAWLTIDKSGKLAVEATANQDSPLSQGRTPLLGLDVWEHAYYLKYQNKRANYVTAFYNVINWDVVGARYTQARKA